MDAPPPQPIVDRPVSFEVRNVNRTDDPCHGDGRMYTVRGRLIGPRDRVAGHRAVTVYLHGSVLGQRTWRFRAVDGYDYARGQARAGHVSLIYDGLGYGRSDVPHGSDVCGGTEADVAHQVVRGMRRRGFRRVALFGFSFGGYAAELEAATFRDVDALGVESWADHLTARFVRALGPGAEDCANGGRRKRPGDARGYRWVFHRRDERVMLASPARGMRAALYRAHERDPCGLGSSAAGVSGNPERLGTITVPVLLVYGTRDALFAKRSRDAQRDDFTGTDDLSYKLIEGAGHFLTLEGRAPAFRALVHRWLRARGL
ncbi:MAG TPA: alpha/beta hydrolase [Thermoleophilaceae bacterium]|nr:alpha/beta hydrolase [Thermoleophilaceae bacterium]